MYVCMYKYIQIHTYIIFMYACVYDIDTYIFATLLVANVM